ncbi:acylphosphatase [Patescibacteria group bacterium]
MIKRLRIKVFGKVQAVSFRYYAQEKAEKLGLAGVTRNRDDGSVEIIAEGAEDKLIELLNWAQLGPSTAEVERTEKSWQKPTNEFTKFIIQY